MTMDHDKNKLVYSVRLSNDKGIPPCLLLSIMISKHKTNVSDFHPSDIIHMVIISLVSLKDPESDWA